MNGSLIGPIFGVEIRHSPAHRERHWRFKRDETEFWWLLQARAVSAETTLQAAWFQKPHSGGKTLLLKSPSLGYFGKTVSANKMQQDIIVKIHWVLTFYWSTAVTQANKAPQRAKLESGRKVWLPPDIQIDFSQRSSESHGTKTLSITLSY